jgi:hypothetical protein
MSEKELQGFVADLIRLNGVDKLIALHIANEGQRAPRTGAFLKRQGMLPGAADWSITLPGGKQHWLELKAAKGRLSPTQKDFQVSCIRNGSPYAVARTPEEAATILMGWGAIKENPLSRASSSKPTGTKAYL